MYLIPILISGIIGFSLSQKFPGSSLIPPICWFLGGMGALSSIAISAA